MKRITFISVLALLMGFGLSAKAQSVVQSWSIGTPTASSVTATLYSDSSFVVSGSGAMADYGSASYVPWYSSYRNAIKTAVIGNSVTSVGNYAFSGCSKLISVTIPNSITSIGNYAFQNCSSLTSITFGNGVIGIGSYVFSGCSSLSSVVVDNNNPKYSSIDGIVYSKIQDTLILCPQGKMGIVVIPNSATIIRESAFSSCSKLNTVTIGDSVTSIGRYAFENCTSLQTVNFNAINCTTMGMTNAATVFPSCTAFTTLVIGNQVKTIPNYAFCKCNKLTSVALGNSVTSIGWSAFENCSSLTSVTIPNSVTSLSSYTFSGCSGLDSINVDNNNPRYCSIGGILYNKMQDTLIVCPGGRIGIAVVSNSVTTIGEYAFIYCRNLTSVTIGSHVTTIGTSAFASCSSLTSITSKAIMPPTLGSSAFSNVATNIPIYVPCLSVPAYKAATQWKDFSNYVGSGYDTSGTTGSLSWYLNLCDSTLTISGSGAMPNYSGSDAPWYSSYRNQIKTVVIGDSVTTIGDFAFYQCNNLSSVTIGNNVQEIGTYTFYQCGLTSVTIPNSVTDIGGQAFRDCRSLTSVTLGNGLTEIGHSVFYLCTNLTSINIPNSVTTIGALAFYSCDKLTSVTIPNSVTWIEQQAFEGCGLTSISIPNSVTKIGSSAFSYCSSLLSIDVDNNNPRYSSIDGILYTKIQDTLMQCPGGKTGTVIILNSVTTIENGAFVYCSLDSVIISNNITNIPNNTFSYCSRLRFVNIPNSVTSIGNYAFYGCDSLSSINIPSSITSIGDRAFFGCSSLTSVTIPNGVTSIGDYVFYSCRKLASVSIPNSITSIGNYAFQQCDSLKNIIIPNSVTSIGQQAFYRCISLTSMTCNAIIPPTLGSSAFSNTSIPVYVPCGSISDYQTKWTYFSNIIGIAETTLVSEMACAGTYNGYGFYGLTQAGTYYDTVKNSNNCDSIIALTLSYYPSVPITQYADTLCFGAVYNDDNLANLTQAGIYYDTLYNINGCDSIIELTLNFHPQEPITPYTASFYIGNPYSDAHFTNLTQAGVYYDTLYNINCCDSIIELTLTGLNASISGMVTRQDQTPLSAGLVELYTVLSGQYSLSDTATVSNTGTYEFVNVANGNYVVKFTPEGSENALPTYYGNTEFWDSASIVSIANNLPAGKIDIVLIPLSQLGGSSLISGYVGEDGSSQSISQKSVEHPAEGVNVYLQKSQSSTWKTVARTLTNAEGYFEFRNVSAGKYRVMLDVSGLKMYNPQIVDIKDGDTITNIEYEITGDSIVNKSEGEVGIVSATLNNQIRVYPNPANYELRITNYETGFGASQLKEGEVVEIYSVVGQKLMQLPCRDVINHVSTIDVSGLASGMYFLKIGDKTVRFVKE